MELEKKVIEFYEKWVRACLYLAVGRAIEDLPEDAILGCFCHPKDCHGDIIIKIWKELHETR